MKHLSLYWALPLAATLSFSAYAGNGGGYGGPDLAAEVIPQEFNGITLGDIQKSAEVCLAEGDLKNGIVSLAQRMVQTLYPDQPIQPINRPVGYDYFGRVGVRAEEFPDELAQSLGWSHKMGLSVSVTHGQLLEPTDGVPGVGNSAGYQLSSKTGFIANIGISTKNVSYPPTIVLDNYRGKALSLSLVDLNGNPGRDNTEDQIVISFKEKNYFPKYDRFGRIVSSTLTFDGVSVSAPMPVVRFKNYQTDRVLDLQLSQGEAVNCMRTELQKAAK